MSASEEESFVVLGSNSMTSMRSYEKISLPNQLESNSLKGPKEVFSGLKIEVTPKISAEDIMFSSTSEKDLANSSNLESNPLAGVKEEIPAPQNEVVVNTPQEEVTTSEITSCVPSELGIMQTGIYSQYPPVSVSASLDPVISLNFMSEYVEMKNKLTEGNALLLKCHETIATLRDENDKLKHEIGVKTNDEEQNRKDQIESVPIESTNIENPSGEIKNEQQQSIDKENESSLNEKKISTLVAENIYLRQQVEVSSKDLAILKKDQENLSSENEKLRSELDDLKTKYDEAERKRCKEPGIVEIITFGSTL